MGARSVVTQVGVVEVASQAMAAPRWKAISRVEVEVAAHAGTALLVSLKAGELVVTAAEL